MTDRAFVPKLARKARLRFDRHAGGWMIVYPERGLALNDSAAAIAKLCDGSRSLGVIIEELGAAAGQDVSADVFAFVDDLRRKGLLEA